MPPFTNRYKPNAYKNVLRCESPVFFAFVSRLFVRFFQQELKGKNQGYSQTISHFPTPYPKFSLVIGIKPAFSTAYPHLSHSLLAALQIEKALLVF